MDEVLPHRRFTAGKLLLLGVLLLGAALAAPGQEAGDSPKHYFNEDTFEIPFDMAANRNVRQVLLHASTDGRTFKEVASAEPGKKHFVYNATREGWHYFVVQVEDNNGSKTPARVDPSAVDLRVCIDKKAPELKVFKEIVPQQGTGTVGVEWDVEDNESVDLRRLRLEYRPAGAGRWTALNVRQDIPLRKAQYGWTPRDAGDYEVRLTAYDMAGNKVERTVRVRAAAGGETNHSGSTPANDAPRGRVIFVPKKTFKLEYKIDNVGPSKVKNVEVWMTRDTKQWLKYRDDAPAEPLGGYELTVVSAGRWGFTLRPISGVGRASRAPSVNEQPQIWIEVDEKPPVVRLLGVTVGEGADTGTITVNYSATDQWLRDKPITVSYSQTRTGPWTPLKAGLINTGSEKIATKEITPYEFYVKVEAADEAGHTGEDVTRDSVKVDLNEPTVKDLTVIGVKRD